MRTPKEALAHFEETAKRHQRHPRPNTDALTGGFKEFREQHGVSPIELRVALSYIQEVFREQGIEPETSSLLHSHFAGKPIIIDNSVEAWEWR